MPAASHSRAAARARINFHGCAERFRPVLHDAQADALRTCSCRQKATTVILNLQDQGVIVARSMAPAPTEMAAKAVPIEAGTATVEARVSVTFELE